MGVVEKKYNKTGFITLATQNPKLDYLIKHSHQCRCSALRHMTKATVRL